MFEPLPVGEVVLPNRIMQTAHSKGFADYGLESPRDLAYYLERARGGVGLLIAVLCISFVLPDSMPNSVLPIAYALGIRYAAEPYFKEPIREHVAFHASQMDSCWVGDEQAVPQPGGFYGGWITSCLVGPFKGAPGSAGW